MFSAVHALVLTRSGLVFVEPGGGGSPDALVRAVELELAALGHVASSRLRARLATLDVAALAALRSSMIEALAAALGADQKHEPLFSRFPEGVPDDTEELWLRKVLSHYLQEPGEPCLFCRQQGSTHVLSPCRHVVCDRCFDGSNYTACPVCERQVDRSSPFFRPDLVQRRAFPEEKVVFKLLDLGEGVDEVARALWVSFCARKQAMSPADVEAFSLITSHHGEGLLAHLPAEIPVKENIALVFGALLHLCPTPVVMAAARPYLKTATDILRMIAVHSHVEPSLARKTVLLPPERLRLPGQWWGKGAVAVAELLARIEAAGPGVTGAHAIESRRFLVAPLRRPLRRAIFEIMEGFAEEAFFEDLLRYRSHWVWLGEFLHPHEFARRFPQVARGFALVRGKAPDGTVAPSFSGHGSRVEAALQARDTAAVVRLLRPRPGELARRLDQALRVAGEDEAASRLVLEAFLAAIPSCSTPVLLTLRGVLPTRDRPAAVRIYWPKGAVSLGVSAPDRRAPLSPREILPAVEAIDREMVRRFARSLPGSPTDFVIDEALGQIIAPFNERTASPAAVALPRGSWLRVPESKLARLFLHWCQPEGGESTDLDLSVGFYGDAWNEAGVCSYYQLKFAGPGGVEIATSAGDRQDAPFPEGATELVDIHRQEARRAGCRWAVMIVNAYSGPPFDALERGFAGLMLRDSAQGLHFDPRTVDLRFSLQGKNGVFLPLVFDLQESRMHWLDCYSTGNFAMNNAASSKKAITKICPELIGYFASGIRLSMLGLAQLHAAARATRVFVRGESTSLFVRRPSEDAVSFLARLRSGPPDEASATLPATPLTAFLLRGDLALAPGSRAYALFREQLTGTLSASDLLV